MDCRRAQGGAWQWLAATRRWVASWALGGEVISRLQIDSGLRRRPIEQLVLTLIGDDGGPLLSHGQSDAEQRSFDATCRKLFRFLCSCEVSHRHNAQSSAVAANRPRH